MINLFSTISATSSEALNLVIQAVLFELAIFLAIPLAGIIVNSVVVGGVRKILSKVLGSKLEYAFSNYVLCIGTMIHELSHAFFAFITGAKVTEIALFKPENGSLGHVNFQPRGNRFARALQSGFSACAPVAVGLIICGLFITKVFPALSVTWQWVAAIYVFVSVVFHMNMSKADLKVYFSGTLSLLLVFLPISIIAFILA